MKKTRVIASILCALICTALCASTKQYSVRHYSVADGLPQNTVMTILEDRDGFMWIGTWDGMCRYDGYQFKTYKPSLSGSRIASNRIDYLYEDSLGFIWTRTYDGAFYRLNKHSEKILPTDIHDTRFGNRLPTKFLILEQKKGTLWFSGDNQLLRVNEQLSDEAEQLLYTLHGEANFLLQDAENSIWAGTNNGLEHFAQEQSCHYPGEGIDGNHFSAGLAVGDMVWFGAKDGSVLQYSTKSHRFERLRLNLHSSISAIAQLDDEHLIITTLGDGLLVYNIRSGKYKHVSSKTNREITSDAFDKPFVDKKGNAWFINGQLGVWRYNHQQGLLRHYTIKIDERYRYQLDRNFFAFEDCNGHLWMNPQGGGFCCYDAVEDKLYSPLGGCTNMVHAACSSREGSIWLGTYDLGLDRVDVRDEQFTLSSRDQQTGESRSICQLHNGDVLIGGKDKVVRRYHDHVFLGEEPIHDLVYTITEKADGTIVYGTKGGGIYMQQGKRVKQYTVHEDDPSSLSCNAIYDLLWTPDSSLFIATYGGGINIFKDGIFRHPSHGWDSYPNDFGSKVRDMSLINDTTVWAASTNGLLRIHLGTLETKAFPFFDIRSIVHTPDGHVWLGTFGGGLIEVLEPDKENVLEESNIHVYTSQGELMSDIVLAIVPQENGDLWFAFEEGISHYDSKTQSFQHFDVLSSLPKAVFSEAKGCVCQDGEIYFGYNFGYCCFRPEEVFHNEAFPKILLTDFLLANKPVEIGPDSPLTDNICYASDIYLKHDQTVFSICYAAMDYPNADKILYAYKLGGVDNEWNYVEHNRMATYTNLSPGDYTFRVRSTNAEGVWGDNERTIAIHIEPSFWVTPWAWTTYLCLAVFFIWLIYRNFKTGNELRQEMAIEQKVTDIKLRFFTNISHELRTPLTLISGPIENILHTEDISPAVRTQLEIVSSNASRMLRLINQILDFRKIQNNKMRLRVQETDLNQVAKNTFGNFTKEASDKHVTFTFEPSDQEVMAWVDRDRVDTIIYNLLSNAFKFTPSGKSITLRVCSKPNFAVIEVSDTGIGIPKDKRAVLFERFASNNEINTMPDKQGTGIGLNLVKELVDLHHGYIEVTSELGKGSTFSVMFQPGKEHFRQEAEIIVDDRNTAVSPETQVAEEENIDQADPNLRSILIVDDNDDMRVFLRSILSANYNILTAADGQEALQVAAKADLNLVISDLMMPNMDGLELTDKLKNDVRTSHIPVVLLTAKAAIESRLEALQYGADDYITKPFSPEYLLARIDNIIRQRESLQETFQRRLLAPKEAPKEEAPKSPNDIFLEKLYTYMMSQLDNNALTVDDLVREMALGRTVFFNKLKSLTGLSPVEYIRDVRIKNAAELLLDPKYNITEVAYMVGMNDSRYFAKCFKAAYGITPTEYKRQNSKNNAQ